MTPKGFDKYFLVRGAGRHAKFARLTDSERCAHVFGVLSIAAGAPIRGYLLVGEHEAGPDEIAQEAGGGVNKRVARSALKKLKAVGVLVFDEEVDAWRVHDWSEVNPDPKKDPTGAKRQADLRARRKTEKAARNGGVTV